MPAGLNRTQGFWVSSRSPARFVWRGRSTTAPLEARHKAHCSTSRICAMRARERRARVRATTALAPRGPTPPVARDSRVGLFVVDIVGELEVEGVGRFWMRRVACPLWSVARVPRGRSVSARFGEPGWREGAGRGEGSPTRACTGVAGAQGEEPGREGPGYMNARVRAKARGRWLSRASKDSTWEELPTARPQTPVDACGQLVRDIFSSLSRPRHRLACVPASEPSARVEKCILQRDGDV